MKVKEKEEQLQESRKRRRIRTQWRPHPKESLFSADFSSVGKAARVRDRETRVRTREGKRSAKRSAHGAKRQRDTWIKFHSVVLEVSPRTIDHAVAEHHTVVLENPADHSMAASLRLERGVSRQRQPDQTK